MQSRMVNLEIQVTLGAKHKAKTKQKTENLKDEQHELCKKKSGVEPMCLRRIRKSFFIYKTPAMSFIVRYKSVLSIMEESKYLRMHYVKFISFQDVKLNIFCVQIQLPVYFCNLLQIVYKNVFFHNDHTIFTYVLNIAHVCVEPVVPTNKSTF